MKTMTGLAQSRVQPPNQLAEPRSCVLSKWTLLQAVEDIREPLGLRGTSIALLRSMISFIKGDHITTVSEDGHICFASNAALAKRTHVSVQTVERHISKLVSLGLLRRRSSGNGKRWARRDAKGRVVVATGLSLMPLAERYADFVQQNETQEEERARMTVLRDRCLLALTDLKSHLPARADLDDLVKSARNLLRRRQSADVLVQLLDTITSELQSEPCPETVNLRATDHENEGHKEPNLNPSVKEKDQLEIEVSSAEMERAYPKLCAELRTARTQEDCENRMFDLARYMDLGELWLDIKRLGSARSFMTLGYLLERIDQIKKPKSYALYLVQGLQTGSIEWASLLRPVQRTSNG